MLSKLERNDLIVINDLIYQVSHLDREKNVYFYKCGYPVLLTEKLKSLITTIYKLDKNGNYIKESV